MSEMDLTEKLSLALECKQYRELISRLYDDLAAVKKAHKEAVEFNYDLAEENIAVHTKVLAMQERIAELKEAQRWIPCSERLPDISTTARSSAVLIWCPRYKNIFCACWNYENNKWEYFAQGSVNVDENVTHWMPLPKPPEEQWE